MWIKERGYHKEEMKEKNSFNNLNIFLALCFTCIYSTQNARLSTFHHYTFWNKTRPCQTWTASMLSRWPDQLWTGSESNRWDVNFSRTIIFREIDNYIHLFFVGGGGGGGISNPHFHLRVIFFGAKVGGFSNSFFLLLLTFLIHSCLERELLRHATNKKTCLLYQEVLFPIDINCK